MCQSLNRRVEGLKTAVALPYGADGRFSHADLINITFWVSSRAEKRGLRAAMRTKPIRERS